MMDMLPVEILEKIIGYSDIDLRDVVTLCYTCKYFNNIIQNSNRVWKGIYHKQLSYDRVNNLPKLRSTFKQMVKTLFELRSEVGRALDILTLVNYKSHCLEECVRNFWEHFDAIYNYEDVLHYLRAIYHRKRLNIWMDPISKKQYGNRRENFTLEYYVSDLLMYKNQRVTIDEMESFVKLPEDKQLLEVAATLVAKWCQPELKIAYKDIAAKLNKMAMDCSIVLRYHHPDHPYFEQSEGIKKKWRTQKLMWQNYSIDQRMQLINIINKVLFDKYKLLGDTFDYYSMNNSFINCVLERKSGLPIILSVIYESVARRMGLICEPLNTPVHFLLKLQAERGANSILFIDAFNAHTFTRLNDEGKLYSAEKIPIATPIQVLQRMVANVDKAWEKSGILHPTVEANDDSFPKLKVLNRMRITGAEYFTDHLHLDPIYEYHRITSQGVLFKNSLKNVQFNYRPLVHIAPRCRPSGMLYAVGVIVIYKVEDEVKFYGVIIDWSPVYDERMDTLNEFRNYKTNFKNQPFYRVLAEDRIVKYLPEEYLSLVVHHYPQRFFHENLDLGKHFCRFEDGVFIPNTAKSKEYAEDDIYRLVISKDVLGRMIRQALRQDDHLAVGYRCQCFKRNGLMCRMPYMNPIFKIFCTCDEPAMY